MEKVGCHAVVSEIGRYFSLKVPPAKLAPSSRLRSSSIPGSFLVLLAFSVSALLICLWPSVLLANCSVGQDDAGHGDCIPRFDENFTMQSRASGDWGDPTTWTPSRVPTSGDIVRIGSGHQITYGRWDDDSRISVIGIVDGGALRFATNRSSLLRVGTIYVRYGGMLTIGTEAAPIQPTATVQIVFSNQPLLDPHPGPQMSNGLVVNDGTCLVHGAPITPFVQLAAEPTANGNTLLTAETPSGWVRDQWLVLPGTEQRPLGWEVEGAQRQIEHTTIGSVNGNQVNIHGTWSYNHYGARNLDGGLEFLPHVANMTRNVVFSSEDPNGVRGHIQCLGRSAVDIRYASFFHLGRTTMESTEFPNVNRIGRYTLHMHHLIGPATPLASGYQFNIIGNSFYQAGGPRTAKWEITLHDSHYGLVKDNVVVGAAGAGIVTEDGNETGNMFDHNLVIGCLGIRGRAQDAFEAQRVGAEGSAFWFRGPNNYVKNNNAYNFNLYGYTFYAQFLPERMLIPAAQGEHPSVSTNITGLPLRQFENNMAAAGWSGLTNWWNGMRMWDVQNPGTMPESVIKDFKIWHVQTNGYFGYETQRVTFDGLVALNHPSTIMSFPTGLWYGDYSTRLHTVKNSRIEGFFHCMQMPVWADRPYGQGTAPADAGVTVVKDSTFRCHTGALVESGYMIDQGGAANTPPQRNIFDNVIFRRAVQGEGKDIEMDPFLWRGTGTKNAISRVETHVYRRNGNPDDNFQLFFLEQDPGAITPHTDFSQPHPRWGASRQGVTNAQNMEDLGIAFADQLATCSNTAAHVRGYICPPGSRPPLISVHPESHSVPVNTRVEFHIVAEGQPAPSYQWQKDGVDLDAATGQTYIIEAAQVGDAGSYRCRVSNNLGTTFSYSGRLTVENPQVPSVSIAAPREHETVGGTAVTLRATVAGSGDADTVKFFLDEGAQTPILTVYAPDFSGQWNSTLVSDGDHTLVAMSYSADQRLATSAMRMFHLMNADTTPPIVTITSPDSNELVSGIVTVAATATDNVDVTRVDFYDGLELIGSDASAPYSFDWDTTGAADGNHDLSAKAYDAAGLEGVSAEVPVTIDNSAPSVSITQPLSNSRLQGIVSVTAEASDDVGIARVEFYYGENLIGADLSAPFSVQWNTLLAANRSYALTAKAYDHAGYEGVSPPVNVEVANPSILPPIIVRQPQTELVLSVGHRGSLDVVAVGAGPMEYRWQRNNVDILGATQARYEWVATASDQGAHYRCFVKNAGGETASDLAIVRIRTTSGSMTPIENGVRIRPNPKKPSDPQFEFEFVEDIEEAKIFNRKGVLVQTLTVQNRRTSWDAKNSSGEPVATGTYIIVFTDDSGSRADKLSVQK